MEKELKITGKDIQISDGYHTFDELYEHRIVLFIALCKELNKNIIIDDTKSITTKIKVWKSKLHSDGTTFEGWFVMGIGKEKGKQITYHLPIEKWEDTEFAETLENAPEWDGHTPEDVLNRISKF